MKTIKEIAVENRITSIDLVPVLSNNFDNPMFYKYNNLIVLKNSEKKITIYTNRDVKTIRKHIGNVFEYGELKKNSTVANFETIASDGKIYNVIYYNLYFVIYKWSVLLKYNLSF